VLDIVNGVKKRKTGGTAGKFEWSIYSVEKNLFLPRNKRQSALAGSFTQRRGGLKEGIQELPVPMERYWFRRASDKNLVKGKGPSGYKPLRLGGGKNHSSSKSRAVKV